MSNQLLLLTCALSLFSNLPLSVWGHDKGHIQVASDAPVHPWTHLEPNNDPNRFQFAIVTDRTGGHRDGVFEEAIHKLNLLQPEFVMSVGDLIEGYIQDKVELHHQWDQIDGFVNQLEMPFFYLPGNHDITNPVQAEVWEERLGRSYYHFVYRDVLFLCLNTEDGQPTNISDDQIDYFKHALADNPEVRWTLVFLHKPLWTYAEPHGFEKIETLLEGRSYTVFAGHYHNYTKYERKDQRYIVLATTGGISSLRGPVYGEFDHVAWITMTDNGPILANLLLNGIWDEDVVTEATGNLVKNFTSGRSLSILPIPIDETEATVFKTSLRVTNDADVPLSVQGHFTTSDTTRIEPEQISLEMPPNSVEIIELDLDFINPLNQDQLPSVLLEWNAVFAFDERSDLKLQGTSPLPILYSRPLVKRDTPITVDGKLDEWNELPYEGDTPLAEYSEAWSGPQDSSFTFGAAYDDAFIYVAIQVLDDQVDNDLTKTYWLNDGIDVWFNATKDPTKLTDRLVLGIHPQNSRLDFPEGAIGISQLTEVGYNVEFAIPIDYVIKRQGPDWKSLQFNVGQMDIDADGSTQSWWHPSWIVPGNHAGLGTFKR